MGWKRRIFAFVINIANYWRSSACRPWGGGGTPLCKLKRYVPPYRFVLCAVLVWKRVYSLPILVGNRVWFFSGNYGIYWSVWRYLLWVREKEKYANSKWIWRIFCLRGGGGKFVRVCNCGVASIVFSGKSGGKKSISLHVFPNGMRHFENTPIYNEFRKFILRLFVCVPRVFFLLAKNRKNERYWSELSKLSWWQTLL